MSLGIYQVKFFAFCQNRPPPTVEMIWVVISMNFFLMQVCFIISKTESVFMGSYWLYLQYTY